MTPFTATHLRRTHTILVAAAPDRVFPLLTPEGERQWVNGWDPVVLHPETGNAPGAVFTTGADEETTYWAVADLDTARHRARYVRVTPASRFGFVAVACEPVDDGCLVHVTYEYTALTESGNRYLESLTEDAYRAMIDEWQRLLDEFLAR